MRVLVTRAAEDAARTARRLAERGHQAAVAPVTTIEPTGTPPPQEPWDALLLTSAHAVPALAALDRRRPVFAVGARTAAAARAAGFAEIRSADGDSRALARLVVAALAPAATLLHATAPDRKPEPGATLQAAGFRLLVWECYEARAASRLPETALNALRAGQLDAALHLSQRSAELLVGLAEREGLVPALRSLPHLCLSADVAAPLAARGFTTRVAPEPDEASLLALLDTVRR
jgi:uroporphyrinogen-III synthase